MYADVVFPLKIPPHTYNVPPGAPSDLKGRLVKAPLAGRSSFGLIVDVFEKPDSSFKTDMKEIQSVLQHFASEQDISFLKWLSEYYLTPIGIALKSSFFDETIKAVNKSGVTKQAVSSLPELTHNVQQAADTGAVTAEPALSSLCSSIKSKTYRSFLFHAQSAMHEYSFLSDILFKMRDDINGVIILVPEIGWIERLESILKPIFGGRLTVLHSKLSKGKKSESIRRIVAAESDVVIGTRSAVLAPLSNISFIAVLGEHSRSYKGEEGLRYNGRDVAVMRGYIEKSCVCLSSICPSVESVYNSVIGKYFPVGSP
ncbi:MAG: hypothetical protein HY099_05940, partial [Nitrospirae bacterium]|nr:hypothetical protein [Nitrospirota bacterium]